MKTKPFEERSWKGKTQVVCPEPRVAWWEQPSVCTRCRLSFLPYPRVRTAKIFVRSTNNGRLGARTPLHHQRLLVRMAPSLSSVTNKSKILLPKPRNRSSGARMPSTIAVFIHDSISRAYTNKPTTNYKIPIVYTQLGLMQRGCLGNCNPSLQLQPTTIETVVHYMNITGRLLMLHCTTLETQGQEQESWSQA